MGNPVYLTPVAAVVNAAANPHSPPTTLAQVAYHSPSLRPTIFWNPGTPPELREWIAAHPFEPKLRRRSPALGVLLLMVSSMALVATTACAVQLVLSKWPASSIYLAAVGLAITVVTAILATRCLSSRRIADRP